MSQIVWRIASDSPNYEADELSGAGAKAIGGRWNAKGSPVVYASATIALACLETIVHLNTGSLPFNRYLVAIDIPEEVWARAQHETARSPKVGWDAEPAGRVSIRFGTDWLAARTSAVLVVPSVVIPEEFNVLLNPLHADAASITAVKMRRWTYDPRFARTASWRRDHRV